MSIVVALDQLRKLEGSVYLIPLGKDEYAMGQVASGGDLAVFEGVLGRDTSVPTDFPAVLFRVNFAVESIRMCSWIYLGKRQLEGDLARPSPYGYDEPHSDHCFIVMGDYPDEAVSCEKIRGLEPLATWGHVHIVDRFKKAFGVTD